MNFHHLYVIIVIRIDQYPPSVRVISEEYEVDNITVTLQWTHNQQLQGGDILSHNVSVSPPVPLILNFNGTDLELDIVLKYNTEYNLSVEADIRCGPNATGFISLNYGEPYVCNLCENTAHDSIKIAPHLIHHTMYFLQPCMFNDSSNQTLFLWYLPVKHT